MTGQLESDTVPSCLHSCDHRITVMVQYVGWTHEAACAHAELDDKADQGLLKARICQFWYLVDNLETK